MFEDLESWLKKNNKPNFGKRGGDDDDDTGMPPMEEIAKAIAKEIGGEVQVLGGGKGLAIHKHISGDNFLQQKMQGLAEAVMYIGKALGAKPSCVDAVGNELKVGDVLKVPGGERKTVLEVGYKFCMLSRTDDQTRNDGAWYEGELKKGNFIK